MNGMGLDLDCNDRRNNGKRRKGWKIGKEFVLIGYCPYELGDCLLADNFPSLFELFFQQKGN